MCVEIRQIKQGSSRGIYWPNVLIFFFFWLLISHYKWSSIRYSLDKLQCQEFFLLLFFEAVQITSPNYSNWSSLSAECPLFPLDCDLGLSIDQKDRSGLESLCLRLLKDSRQKIQLGNYKHRKRLLCTEERKPQTPHIPVTSTVTVDSDSYNGYNVNSASYNGYNENFYFLRVNIQQL